MTTLNVPSISRKKPVPCHFDCNSFRVFGEEVKNRSTYQRPPDLPQEFIQTYDKTLNLPSWYYNTHYEPERNIRDRNRCEVTYLRRNVRTLNHPVCYVPSAQEEQHWWPSRVPSMTKPTPPKSKDNTMRSDYDWSEEHQSRGSSRHKHNTSRPALGAVPVNFLPEKDGRQRFYKEGISYEHQYDSRKANNYPMRNARLGAYVSQPITEQRAAQLLDNPEDKWRANSLIKSAGESQAQTINTLPGIGEHLCRSTDRPNHKRRSNFDIAPRSNLNVRVREYIPSQPVQTNQITQQAPAEQVTSHPPSVQIEVTQESGAPAINATSD